MFRTRLLAGTVAGLAALAVVGAGTPTTAAPAPAERPLAGGLLSPLSLAVDSGTVYYTQNFAGTLHMKRAGEKPTLLYTAKKGTEIGGVEATGPVVTFVLTSPDGQTSAKLINTAHGNRLRPVGDLDRHEKQKNPDRKVRYGIRGIDDSCAAKFPKKGMPATYRGIVESHPYATLPGRGRVFVADAAANAILRFERGFVSTVAVLPPVPVEVTASLAKTMKMPACAVGETYFFEAVPTDVERGPDNKLYVSTLPGGPEDGSMAGHAAVYRVDPNAKNGKATKVLGGLTSATGLAVSPEGDLYVAQLFGGTIVKAAKGAKKATPFAKAMLPGDVEWSPRGIYATTGVLTGLEPGTKPEGAVEVFGN